jgi:hypothetical protein
VKYETKSDPVDIDCYVREFWKDDITIRAYMQDNAALVRAMAECKTSRAMAAKIVEFANDIWVLEREQKEFEGEPTFIAALDEATQDWLEEQARDADDLAQWGTDYFRDYYDDEA